MSWFLQSLGNLLEPSGRDRAGNRDLPVLSITMKNGLVDQSEKFKKRIASLDTSNYRVAYKNELVVGFPIDEGVIGFQTKYPAGIVSPAYDIWCLKDEANTYIPYFERILRSPQARSLYASKMQGAVARRRSLTKGDFLNLEIPFPLLEDQIRIAHLLGKVDELIAHRKHHLQQLDDLLKSVFLEMFGDPVRNDKGWKTPSLIEVTDFENGDRSSNYPSGADLIGEGILFLSTKNIVNNQLDLSNKTFITREKFESLSRGKAISGDVLITLRGTLGSCCIFDSMDYFEAFINAQMMIIRPKPAIQSIYLHGFITSQRISGLLQQIGTGAAVPQLTATQLKELRIPLPPTELQNQFATIVEKIEGVKSLNQQSLTDLEALYGTLSQQAFKGELDLSRIPLPSAPVNNENESAPMTAIFFSKTTPKIVLPEPAADAKLNEPQQRQQAIAKWLDAYRLQLGEDEAFATQAFVAAANDLLLAREDETPAWSLVDHDQLKDWVFVALASGKLKQAYDDEGNHIALQSAAATQAPG